jgi:hypothetical protein
MGRDAARCATCGFFVCPCSVLLHRSHWSQSKTCSCCHALHARRCWNVPCTCISGTYRVHVYLQRQRAPCWPCLLALTSTVGLMLPACSRHFLCARVMNRKMRPAQVERVTLWRHRSDAALSGNEGICLRRPVAAHAQVLHKLDHFVSTAAAIAMHTSDNGLGARRIGA